MHFNIADLLESVVDTVPDKPALVSGDRVFSYAEFEARANKLAHAMQAAGVGPGDKVGLYIYNSHEYLEAMFATMKVRAISININYRYVADELRYMFNDAGLKALIYQRELADTVRDAATGFDDISQFVYIEDGSGEDVDGLGVEYEAFVAPHSDERDFAERSGDDLYVIYTGGTTGMPKGVMWRQEDLFFAGLQGGNPQGDDIERPEDLAAIVKEGDFGMTVLPAPPFIHGTSQFASLIMMFGGGKVVVVPGRSYDPALCLKAVGDHGVNVIVLVGDAMCRPFVDELKANSDKYDVDTLFVVTSQGAILSRSIQADLSEVMPNAMILNNFGASETGHQGRALPDMSGGAKDSRIKFMMNEHTKVLDDDGQPIEPGSDKIGMLARSGRIPQGYHNDPEKTARTFKVIDGVRYVVPGDYASVDEDGFITLLGRGSICINTGGEKVYPEEVEEALKAHPAVEDTMVVGVPDDRWGSRVEAVIKLRAGMSATGEQLSEHCRTKVAAYKTPKGWHFVDEMARHPSGKPDYRWAKAVAVG